MKQLKYTMQNNSRKKQNFSFFTRGKQTLWNLKVHQQTHFCRKDIFKDSKILLTGAFCNTYLVTNYSTSKKSIWPNSGLKLDFQQTLFLEQLKSWMDRPERRRNRWRLKEKRKSIWLGHHKVDARVIFWMKIVDNEFVGHWKVADGVKMASSADIKFLKASIWMNLRRQRCIQSKNFHARQRSRAWW